MRLQDPEGACLELARPELEVSRVRSFRALEDQGGEVTLELTLLPDDARRFDALAVNNLGRRVALLIFGRVITAPTVHSDRFAGQLQISGISKADASRIKVALTG